MKTHIALSALLLLCAAAPAEEAPTTKGIIDPAKTERPKDAVVLVGEESFDLVPDGLVQGSPVFDDWRTKMDAHFYNEEERKLLGDAVASAVNNALEGRDK